MIALLLLQAQLITGFAGGDDFSVGPGTAGYDFTVSQSITVRSLGVWDSSGEGLSSSHNVAVWDRGSHALLSFTQVTPSGSELVNGFYYAPLTAPLTLEAGHSYVIGAQYADLDFDLARGGAVASTIPQITLGDARLSEGVGFEFPDFLVSGSNNGFFGPNAAEFLAIPEVGEMALLISCALLVFAIFWSHKRHL